MLKEIAKMRLPEEIIEETENRKIIGRYTPLGVSKPLRFSTLRVLLIRSVRGGMRNCPVEL